MRPNTVQDLRWFRRYKLIAVIGMTAVVSVVLEFLMLMVAGKSASWITLLTCPVGVGIGYLIEHLLLRLSGKEQSQEIDFTYESKIRIPRGRTVLSCLMTAVLMSVFAYWIGSMLDLIRINVMGVSMEKNMLIAFRILLSAAFIVAGCVGCYLRPCAFNQIVGLRSLVECSAVFAFFGALQAIYGNYGISWFFLLCMVVYLLCMAIIMNQIHIIQPSYFSPTCQVTDELRRAGFRAVGRMFGACLAHAWMLLAGLSLLIFPLRILSYSGQTSAFQWLFSFPFENHAVLNLIIFILGLVTMLVMVLYLCLRMKHPGIDLCLGRLKRFLRYIWQSIKRILSRIGLGFRLALLQKSSDLRKRHKNAKQEAPEEIKLTYEDTVILRARPRPSNEAVISYGTFARRVMSQPNAKAQYTYAYRTMVGCLRRKYIGIDDHTTPQEIADIVTARTNIRGIDNITSLFYASAYAPSAPAPTVKEIISLCDIVRGELERERRTK